MMPVKLLGTAAAIAAGLGFATVANAAPLPAASGLSAGDAPIEQVREGCGYRAHRNVYGECRADLPSRPRYGYGGGGGGYGYNRPRPSYGYGGPRY